MNEKKIQKKNKNHLYTDVKNPNEEYYDAFVRLNV